MRWVKDGPDIPVEIVQAVEEARVVFFCGAGVSQQSGLPSFKGLVEAVYKKLHRRRESFPAEEKAFLDQNYDQVFTSLEAAIKEPGLIRRLVAESLALATDADTSTHKALLALATDRNSKCRLVTTNYDRCFSPHVAAGVRIDAAPRLPVARSGRWNSVVHLHGYLADCGDDGRELVLSSADFGAAYLVDGWATRFLRELFQHFIVLFVGYRAEDLVVKYMLQALAFGLAEQGEKPRAFALAQAEDIEQSTTATWEAKGIAPILYPKGDSHDALHTTLCAWAEAASHGLLGRRSIVVERLLQPPPSDHDEVVDQVLWALQDENGATAKYLAEHESPPSPKHWLSVLDKKKLLALGDVPLVGQVGTVPSSRPLHPVTLHLGRWLARHLDEAAILSWALEKRSSLHETFRWIIREGLRRRDIGLRSEIERAWTFLARHQPNPPRNYSGDPFSLARRIESEAWDLQLKSEVTALVEPQFVLVRDRLKEIIRKTTHAESDEFPIEVDVQFTGGQETEYVLDAIRKRPDHDLLLAGLLDDCTAYLRRAMEVQEHFGSASAEQDWTYIWVRSIRTSSSEHYRRALVTLITLAAACMDSASRTNPALARAQTGYWKTIEYPIFKRLVCFGLARPNLFTATEAFDYLSANEFVLWHHTCRTELRELLVHIWPRLTAEQALSLTQTLLKGPPRRFYRSDLPPEDIEEVSKDAIRERLATIGTTDRPLPAEAAELLRVADLAEATERVPSPEEEEPICDLTSAEIAETLRNGFSPTGKYCRQWTDLASNDFPRAVDALAHLAALGAWPTDVWSAALGQAVIRLSGGADTGIFPFLELVVAAPDTVLGENLHSVTLILHFLPNLNGPAVDTLYWRLWDRAFGIAQQATAGEPAVDSVEAALNIPIGRLTDELFEWAGKHTGDVDAEPFWIRLEKACVAGSLGRAARALAAIRTAWLFGSRPEWTRANLLRYFNWKLPDEAKLVWKGFTFGATFSPSLWSALRKDFIATFDNLGQLDAEAVRVFHQLIGRIAIHEPAWLTDDEVQRIVTIAPHIGREQIAWVFWISLDAAGEKAGSLWRDRVGPWLSACWQPDEALKGPETSMNLVRVALAAGDAIPEAVDAVLPRMSPLNHPETVIFLVAESKAPEEFPPATVKLLDRAIPRGRSFYKGDLERLLGRIASAWAEASHDSRFRNLSEFAAG